MTEALARAAALALKGHGDASIREDLERRGLAAEIIADTLGGLDIVCNIAGIGHFANSHEETPEWFDRIEVNATYHAMQTPQTIAGWAKQTRPGFIFDLKLPKSFSRAPAQAAEHDGID